MGDNWRRALAAAPARWSHFMPRVRAILNLQPHTPPAREAALLPAEQLAPQFPIGRAPLFVQLPQPRGGRWNSRLVEQADGDIAIAHAAARLHQAGQAPPHPLPRVPGVELRKHAPAAAEAADGHAKVVDGIGIARARRAILLECQAPQENPGLKTHELAHVHSLALTTEMGRL